MALPDWQSPANNVGRGPSPRRGLPLRPAALCLVARGGPVGHRRPGQHRGIWHIPSCIRVLGQDGRSTIGFPAVPPRAPTGCASA